MPPVAQSGRDQANEVAREWPPGASSSKDIGIGRTSSPQLRAILPIVEPGNIVRMEDYSHHLKCLHQRAVVNCPNHIFDGSKRLWRRIEPNVQTIDEHIADAFRWQRSDVLERFGNKLCTLALERSVCDALISSPNFGNSAHRARSRTF
jgi:hypothetical protein